jgi:hypothetical protein
VRGTGGVAQGERHGSGGRPRRPQTFFRQPSSDHVEVPTYLVSHKTLSRVGTSQA